MADDPARGARDRSSIDTSEEYALVIWSRKSCVSRIAVWTGDARDTRPTRDIPVTCTEAARTTTSSSQEIG